MIDDIINNNENTNLPHSDLSNDSEKTVEKKHEDIMFEEPIDFLTNEPLFDVVTGAEDDTLEDSSNDNSTEQITKTKKGKKKEKKPHVPWYNATLENDIKYRGIMSYRVLRIVAWLFLSLSQFGIFLTLVCKIDPEGYGQSFGTLATVLEYSGNIMMPLFLIANFSTLLNKSKRWGSRLLVYGLCALMIFLLFIIIHDRYLVDIAIEVTNIRDRAAVTGELDRVIRSITKNGFITFNIFMDLLSCTLFGYFFLYNPKKGFTGKKIYIFRSFIAIPILYEMACIWLKLASSLGMFEMPTYVFPFLTTKPMITFMVFVALALYIKFKEKIFNKKSTSGIDYDTYLHTRRNSLEFSICASIIFVVFGLLDLVMYLIYSQGLTQLIANNAPGADAAVMATQAMESIGIGKGFSLIVTIPFIMLFSYTKTHKNGTLDIIIPIAGLGAVLFVYLDEIFQIIKYLCELLRDKF